MTRIDSARLARVLASLTQPKARTNLAKNTSVGGVSIQAAVQRAPARRDPTVLKTRLTQRLKTLKKSNNFAEAAPIVTVQEILRWEFGEETFQHPDFERIAGQVAFVLMHDESLKSAVENVIRTMSERQD